MKNPCISSKINFFANLITVSTYTSYRSDYAKLTFNCEFKGIICGLPIFKIILPGDFNARVDTHWHTWNYLEGPKIGKK